MEYQGIMLTAEELVHRRTKTEFILPTKGPKCFTPSGSWLETKQLQTWLDATKTLIAEERVERENALAQAEWDENLNVARVSRIVGRQFEKFGHEENMTIFLYPEEALYLLETNHLQLLYGGVSMSIQQAYSVLIGPNTGCSFVEYMIFSHLLKNGFKVLRHCAKRTITRYERLIGLRQEHPKNRKSRRKCSAPEKEIITNESYNKYDKIDQKIETKIEEHCTPKHNNGELLLDPTAIPIKGEQTNVLEEVVERETGCEGTVESNSSLGSDIEILSEKSVCRSEESLDYEVTECSSSATEDSDCQVIEEINTETNTPSTNDQRFCSGSKVIEEINLSDSDGSEMDSHNIEVPSHIKSEVTSEGVLCNDAELKESKTFQDEQSNSNARCVSECYNNRTSVEVESSVLETNECSHSCIIEPRNSVILMDSNYAFREVLIEHSVEENDLTVIRTNEDEKETQVQESHEEISGCTSILSGIKEEKMNCISLLPRESVIQRNSSVPFKTENNKDILCSGQKQREIEVIDLDDESSENSVFEDKNTILLSFPNIAGCHIISCDVPPQRLCPPNVCPNQQTYDIILERLQDPRYGGNPKKKKNEGFQNHYIRRENTGRIKMFRYHSRPNRPFNRFNNSNTSRNERLERWREVLERPRDENFSDHPGFREQPMYPNFQSTHFNRSDQNVYPHFSGQPSHNSPSYHHPHHHQRPNWRHRGIPNHERYQMRSPFRNYRYRNSRFRRCPQRRGRGGRSVCPDRYNTASERENNESLGERDGNYVPFNVDNTPCTYEQPRRTLGEKRHRGSYEDNINSSCSGEKRHRGIRTNHLSATSRSQDLLQFLDIIHRDTAENAGVNSVRTLSDNIGDNSQHDFQEMGENVSAFAETESTENSSSSERSCSSDNSSQDTSEESMDESSENETETDFVSVLLKADNMEDIDTCLKSLEIVHTVKFRELAVVPEEPLLTIKFDLYQPSTPFRRSDPPVPDFRVVVMRPDQNFPTSRQLAFLGEGFDDDVPLLFAIASTDSVAFYLQSVVNLPPVSSKEKIQG